MHFCPLNCQPDALGNVPLRPIKTLPLTPRHAHTCTTLCRNSLKRQAEAESPGDSGEDDGAMLHSYCQKTPNLLNMKGNCSCLLFYFGKRAKSRTASCTYRNAELEWGRTNFSVMVHIAWVFVRVEACQAQQHHRLYKSSMCMSNLTAAASDLSGTLLPAWIL